MTREGFEGLLENTQKVQEELDMLDANVETANLKSLSEGEIAKEIDELEMQAKAALELGNYQEVADLVSKLSQIKDILPGKATKNLPPVEDEETEEELPIEDEEMPEKVKEDTTDQTQDQPIKVGDTAKGSYGHRVGNKYQSFKWKAKVLQVTDDHAVILVNDKKIIIKDENWEYNKDEGTIGNIVANELENLEAEGEWPFDANEKCKSKKKVKNKEEK